MALAESPRCSAVDRSGDVCLHRIEGLADARSVRQGSGRRGRERTPGAVVVGVATRGARSSYVVVPSHTTSIASSSESATGWPPLTTTVPLPSAPRTRAPACCSARVRIEVPSSTCGSARLGVRVAAGRRRNSAWRKVTAAGHRWTRPSPGRRPVWQSTGCGQLGHRFDDVEAVASMPVFTAATSRSARTACTWATTNSAAGTCPASTPCVLCAVRAVMAARRRRRTRRLSSGRPGFRRRRWSRSRRWSVRRAGAGRPPSGLAVGFKGSPPR